MSVSSVTAPIRASHTCCAALAYQFEIYRFAFRSFSVRVFPSNFWLRLGCVAVLYSFAELVVEERLGCFRSDESVQQVFNGYHHGRPGTSADVPKLLGTRSSKVVLGCRRR